MGWHRNKRHAEALDITEDEALDWIKQIQQERSYFDLLTRQLDAESQLTGGND